MIPYIGTKGPYRHQDHSASQINNTVDDDLKALVSTVALAASPMGPLYDSTGTPLRRLHYPTWKDAGMIVMGCAAFAGPAGGYAFIFGAGVYVVGVALDI